MDKVIVVRIWEGLGNQLFQYAYAKSLQAKGYEVYLDLEKSFDDTFTKYRHNDSRINVIQNYNITLAQANSDVLKKYEYIKRDCFKSKLVFWLASHSMWKYKFREETIQHYQDKSRNVTPDCYVKGWFQSEKYFSDIAESIRKDISLDYEIDVPEKIRNAIADEQSVSVHIRRGDYVKLHHELNNGYFLQAKKLLQNKLDKPQFIVFSDDIEWVKNNLELPEQNTSYVDSSLKLKDYEELLLMSQCKNHIISNSTFSWWAAWLDCNPNKTVIAPRQWLGGQKDIVPKEWTVI